MSELSEKMGLNDAAPTKVGHKVSRAPRMSLLRRGRVTVDGRAYDVRLRNISVTGLMLELPHFVAPGTRVHVSIQDGPDVDAHIIWWSDNRCGLHFVEAMSLDWLQSERQAKVAF